jgi:hypothetical protein
MVNNYANTPAMKDKNSHYEHSSIGKSFMDRKTAAGDTELNSMYTTNNFFDSPIKNGGKKVLSKDNMFA